MRLNKKRMMGDLVRGDSAFIIACQQTALDFSRLCRKQHLSATQGHLLLALGSSGRTAAKELRRHLCLDAPTFSRALSRLTDAGLVTRIACASKREIEIALTSQGLACATDIAEETTKMLEALLGDGLRSPMGIRTIAALRASLEERL